MDGDARTGNVEAETTRMTAGMTTWIETSLVNQVRDRPASRRADGPGFDLESGNPLIAPTKTRLRLCLKFQAIFRDALQAVITDTDGLLATIYRRAGIRQPALDSTARHMVQMLVEIRI